MFFSHRKAGNREIAILIFTRNPAGSKSNNSIGRSSDLFRFHAFPAFRPVAKIVKPLALRSEQELTATGIVADFHCIPFSFRITARRV